MVVIFEIHRDVVRLKNVQEWWKEYSAKVDIEEDAEFYIVHPPNLMDEHLERWSEIAQRGGAVCFISGYPEGIKPSLLPLMNTQPVLSSRWQILDFSIEDNVPPEVGKRFQTFLEAVAQIKASEPVPWHLLKPFNVDENLIAIYLWVFACSRFESEHRRPDELKPVWEKAQKAYKNLFGIFPVSQKVDGQCWVDASSGDRGACELIANGIRALLERAMQSS